MKPDRKCTESISDFDVSETKKGEDAVESNEGVSIKSIMNRCLDALYIFIKHAKL